MRVPNQLAYIVYSTVDDCSESWRNKQLVAGSLGYRSKIVSYQSIHQPTPNEMVGAAHLLYVIIINAVKGTSSI